MLFLLAGKFVCHDPHSTVLRIFSVAIRTSCTFTCTNHLLRVEIWEDNPATGHLDNIDEYALAADLYSILHPSILLQLSLFLLFFSSFCFTTDIYHSPKVELASFRLTLLLCYLVIACSFLSFYLFINFSWELYYFITFVSVIIYAFILLWNFAFYRWPSRPV